MLKKFLLIIATLLVSIFLFMGTARQAAAAGSVPSSWQKSVSIVPRSPTDLGSGSFAASMQHLKETGANEVTIIIPYYQDSMYTTIIHGGWNTPTDASLIAAIQQIHSLGMGVMLKLHVDPLTGWRADINPANKGAWFANYGDLQLHYAAIAQQTKVEEICIGTELIAMTQPNLTAYWVDMIHRIRGVYAGRLTYSGNWGPSGFLDEKDSIQFWQYLDDIGISAYYNLTGTPDASVGALETGWARWAGGIERLHAMYNKPILFTEIGYRSLRGANMHPWDYEAGGPYDAIEQVNDYTALFAYWSQFSWMHGVSLWYWNTDPNAGGARNTDFTPQNKPAQDTMKAWFQGSGDPPPPQSPTFTLTGVTGGTDMHVGQASQFSVSLKSTSGNQTGMIVDIEIFGGMQRVYQTYFANQAFQGSTVNTYTFTWTPQQAGTFILRAGVFPATWGTSYYWDNSVLQLQVTPDPPPPAGAITMWWPLTNGHLSGVQPFKGLVSNMSLDTYTMYWQVDGGQMNQMVNAFAGGAHKEALVDVSTWHWRGSGPYMITVLAKDLTGKTIASTSFPIWVE